MKPQNTLESLQQAGMNPVEAAKWLPLINDYFDKYQSISQIWRLLSKRLIAEKCDFVIHRAIFISLYPNWRVSPETAPAWTPHLNSQKNTNIQKLMDEMNFTTVKSVHQWSREHISDFWQFVLDRLQIKFKSPPTKICDFSQGYSNPTWLPDAQMNIVDSCLKGKPDAQAIIYHDCGKNEVITYAQLEKMVNRIANSLVSAGFKEQDCIAIAMPMNPIAIATYLAIIKIGAVVVSIADSFSSHEIEIRLSITKAAGIITQDFIAWGKKKLPLYEKVCLAKAPRAIVISTAENSIKLRQKDIYYHDFLKAEDELLSTACSPMQTTNILFSSGTTGTPKSIPWNHTTSLKAASDAYFHQNIQADDVLAWPTNLGWMMGPWLIYAALINNACIALFSGAPHEKKFGYFVENCKVTMLGVVPTLVANWRRTRHMEEYDWSHIKVFSSTGECSNPEDMFYLMWLADYRPVIEYCGGTEIGGAYVSSTVVQPNYPSLFTTPTMGSDFIILDNNGKPSDIGETALIPPAMGLSVNLLNADHNQIYYCDMPLLNGVQLRRHGDQICRMQGDIYTILGRVDDTMNLGGIKISSAEIERTLTDLNSVREVAAIAVKQDKGPSKLVIYAAVGSGDQPDKEKTLYEMQVRINQQLNPLFKISDLVFIKELPKTASNKIMRKELRAEYIRN